MAELEALAARPGTTAEVSPLPGPSPMVSTYDVSAATAEGLTVSFDGQPPKLISYDRVQSLGRIDRLHGAWKGALLAGAPSFVLGFLYGDWFNLGGVCDKPIAGGSCPPRPNPTDQGLKFGGITALIGAVVGGTIGALVGYEDRYFIAPTATSVETASARDR